MDFSYCLMDQDLKEYSIVLKMHYCKIQNVFPMIANFQDHNTTPILF